MNEQPTLAHYEEQLLRDLLAFQTARSPEPAPPMPTRHRPRRADRSPDRSDHRGGRGGHRRGVPAEQREPRSHPAGDDQGTDQRALLDANSGFVIHTSEYIVGVLRAESWDDPAHLRAAGVAYDDSGAVYARNGFVYTGDSARIETANLTTGQWDSLVQKFPPGRHPERITGPGSQYLPDTIRMQLADGLLVVIGHETLDGRDTIHLKQHLPAGIPAEFVPSDIWVDASTYLPIREVEHNALTGTDTVIHFEWLPDTSENLAKTVFKAPGWARRPRARHDVQQLSTAERRVPSSSHSTTIGPAGP